MSIDAMRSSQQFAVIDIQRGTHFVSRLSLILRRHGSRAALRELDDDQLLDIGITRAQALKEADKPFWR